MRRGFAAVVVLLLAGSAQAALPRELRQAFVDAGISLDHVAVVVQDVEARRPLLAYDPNRAMNPASVMKLVTTFVALDLLGPDYRWRTEA
jgi:D-alanyl-D-alanine carboxypeptidase/D-alanyl-D-alanine-endopeptidase (penicillin-binding protein 4)